MYLIKARRHTKRAAGNSKTRQYSKHAADNSKTRRPQCPYGRGKIMNIYAIIPAAGTGSRAGFEKNKILQKMGGVSVIRRTAGSSACIRSVG